MNIQNCFGIEQGAIGNVVDEFSIVYICLYEFYTDRVSYLLIQGRIALIYHVIRTNY
jgi:hypothetical protein